MNILKRIFRSILIAICGSLLVLLLATGGFFLWVSIAGQNTGLMIVSAVILAMVALGMIILLQILIPRLNIFNPKMNIIIPRTNAIADAPTMIFWSLLGLPVLGLVSWAGILLLDGLWQKAIQNPRALALRENRETICWMLVILQFSRKKPFVNEFKTIKSKLARRAILVIIDALGMLWNIWSLLVWGITFVAGIAILDDSLQSLQMVIQNPGALTSPKIVASLIWGLLVLGVCLIGFLGWIEKRKLGLSKREILMEFLFGERA
jgi:hypothetical protein